MPPPAPSAWRSRANPDLALRDGQTAEIMIDSDGTNAHLLPQSALGDRDRAGIRHRRRARTQLPGDRPMTGIVDWAASRARMVIAFIVLSILGGRLAYVSLPKEGEPDIEIPALFVSVPFPGISAEDSESCWSSRWRPSWPISTGSRR
jgi:hypothetical protein